MKDNNQLYQADNQITQQMNNINDNIGKVFQFLDQLYS